VNHRENENRGPGGLEQLEAALGHRFQRPDLLARAVTHSSLSHERASVGVALLHNEQLEFLGDAVLGFLVSRELVERFPGYSEGQLSKMKSHLVSSSHLVRAAERLRLGEFLQLGRGEERSGGRQKRALLENALEAVIAAVYLDGGLDQAGQVVRRILLDDLDKGIEHFPFADYKSALHEYLPSSGRPQVRYQVVAEHGPGHRKTFVVEGRMGDQVISRAEGYTKKTAEQEAARLALLHFREQDEQRTLQAKQDGGGPSDAETPAAEAAPSPKASENGEPRRPPAE
jgi:ribonuclease III